MLRHYLDRHPLANRVSINTFGLGSSPNSKLLCEIAEMGGGAYAFVGSPCMVGSVMVHALANLGSTYATSSTLQLVVPAGLTLCKMRGHFPFVQREGFVTVSLGTLQYGQTRDALFEFKREGHIRGLVRCGSGLARSLSNVVITVDARPWFELEDRRESGTVGELQGFHSTSSMGTPHAYLTFHRARLNLATTLFENLQEAKPSHLISKRKILSSIPASSIFAKDVALAFEEKYLQHYLPSLAFAYQRQQCVNFKYPGLQEFVNRSPLFLQLRDEADDALDNLEVPALTAHNQMHLDYRQGGAVQGMGMGMGNHPQYGQYYPFAPPPPASAYYMNTNMRPCFTGDCRVKLDNSVEHESRHLALEELRSGDVVWTPLGGRRVRGVLRTQIIGSSMELCILRSGSGDGELKVTPYHPIMHEQKWVFPCQVASPQVWTFKRPFIYSLLLDPVDDPDGHAVEIEGFLAVTLGHGLVPCVEDQTRTRNEEDGDDVVDVRTHRFFGDYRAILKGFEALGGPEWERGYGIVDCGGVERDKDNLICGLKGVVRV